MHHDQLHNEHHQLERQVERGELFMHTALSRQSARINEVESFLYAIIDLLTAKGLTIPDEITQTVEKVKQEMLQNKEVLNPGLAIREESESDHAFAPVNCEERLAICKGVCCKLDFALSAEEVENGKLKWDLGRPYFIRHEYDCYCNHLNTENLSCKVYDSRPSVCKKYSCAKDERKWIDFKNMKLNEEWIANNLKERRPKFMVALMFTG